MANLTFVSASKSGSIVAVSVQPRAASDAIVGRHADALRVRVTAPPVDDRANRAVEDLLAAALNIPRARVSVLSGHRSRKKRISVEGVTPEFVTSALSHVLSCRTHEPR